MTNKIYKKISTPVFAILVLVLFGATNIKAAPGDLDQSFSNGGRVVTPLGVYSVYPGAILTQPDGKIVVCGTTYDDYDGDNESYFLARYHPNGTLDASFGTNGKFVVPFSTGSDCALQPDGKIVSVGGTHYLSNGFAVHRYNANGTLDASFGVGGLVITRVGTGDEGASSVVIQADGKIIVVGSSSQLGVDDFTVVRYNPDGSLDTSFNGTGKVITSFAGASSASTALLQPDGKIVAVGYAGTNSNFASAFALVRYNTDGSLDSGFGAGGKVIHAVSTGNNNILDGALQPDGKIVATGAAGAGTNSTIVRYNTNGSIDTSFAQNGIFTTEQNFNVGNSIALQSDGKLIAFGYVGYFTGFAMARLNPNGTLDTSFGTNGRVITPSYRAVADGAMQSDGKILAVGWQDMTDRLEIVRYLGDSAVSRPAQFDFDGDRRTDVSVFRPSDRIWYLNQSTAGFSAAQFGLSTDKITPADFDGDGKTDISVFRDGVWYWLNSSNGIVSIVQFGLADEISIPGLAGNIPIPGLSPDIPIPADYTGDGRAELAIYRGGVWWTLDLSNNQVSTNQFGLAGDEPVVADYDGDGRADQAVYRSGEWHLNRSTQGYAVVPFGLATDIPVPGDYDGDGKADEAVYRPSTGQWWILRSTDGLTVFQFGVATDIPAPADYDGDGKTDAAVYRGGTWYLRQSTSGISVQQFGLPNDKPVSSAYLP